MDEIKYIDDRLRNLTILFDKHKEIKFNDILELTGWDEYILAIVIKKLIEKQIIEEYFNEKYGQIFYRKISEDNDDLLTIEKRLEKLNRNK